MCFGGSDSSATITSNTTPAQDAAQRAATGQSDTGIGPAATNTTTANDYSAAQNIYQGFPVAPPKDAPDLTDELLQKTRTNFALRLMVGKNTKSSFGNTQMGGLTLGNSGLGGN